MIPTTASIERRSPPARGARIETPGHARRPLAAKRSPPARGARIETLKVPPNALATVKKVAPRTGGAD